MATVEQLRDALREALESRGVLAKMRAELRAEIFRALDGDDGAARGRPQGPAENALINELVRDYLEFNGCRSAAAVLAAEAAMPREATPRDVQARELSMPPSADRSMPLLYALVAGTRKGAAPGSASPAGSSSTPVMSPPLQMPERRPAALKPLDGVFAALAKMALSPNFWGLATTAASAVAYGAYRSLPSPSSSPSAHAETVVIEGRQALFFPVMASLSLLAFYFFFSVVSFVATVALLLMAANGVVFCLSPAMAAISHRRVTLPFVGPVPAVNLALYVLTAFAMIEWLASGNWILNNVFGFALAVVFIATVRLPSLRVGAILLTVLFFYDIFWVFYSARIFRHNVMQTVATQPAANPVHVISKAVGLPPPRSFALTLQLPIKIVWGQSLLGLGDIALPGVLLAYYLRYDRQAALLAPPRPAARGGYFRLSFACYVAALALAFVFVALTGLGQPALLYIVPATLIPPAVKASVRGELADLWRGGAPVAAADAGAEGPAGTPAEDEERAAKDKV
eukprot:m51a1_g11149 hypothetical protein (514) ;mRNA; f:242649-245049